MSHTTLIAAEQLQALINSSQPVRIFDCSFELLQPHAGRQQYLASHIPGAVYADLETDLSARHGAPGAHGVLTATGADAPVSGGRHPLPNQEKFATWLSSVGLDNEMQAVVYDRSGANYCGRLWWMLKWVGHDKVAVLDGGWKAWQEAGAAICSGEEPAHFQANFLPGPALARLVDAQTVMSQLGHTTQTLVDARAANRFTGEVEPIDPIAGHIPHALNRPYLANLLPNGKFKPAAQLKAEFLTVLGNRDPATVVHYCGSGVSALCNLIAMEVAGLGTAALYAGSWSDWSHDPTRPVAQGEN